MAESLPKASRLKLRQGLASWRQWQTPVALTVEPELLRPLGDGRSNHSWLVGSDEQHFVLRLDGLNPQRLGISRSAEQRAHSQAAAAGLAPDLRWFNPELGIMVCDYLPPLPPRAERLQELDAIAGLLRQIHRLPPIKFRLQPLTRAQRYQALLGPAESVELEQAFVQACQDLAIAPAEMRLCHNDLLTANRLWSGDGLYALDWEYAAMGHPLFDLAVICEGDQLSEEDCRYLLERYCGGQVVNDETRERFDNARGVYRVLADLWQRCTGA